jgi:hypothetical protein
MLNPDDIFNDPNYEYGEPGEFSKPQAFQDRKSKSELSIWKQPKDTKQDNKLIDNSLDTVKDSKDIALSKDECLNTNNIVEQLDIKSKDAKPWLFKKGNPIHKPAKQKNKNITGLVEERLSKKAEAIKFVNRWFDLFYDTNNKQATTAGQMIWERHEGKVKDVLQISAIVEHIPDQAEALRIANAFRVDTKPEKIAELT